MKTGRPRLHPLEESPKEQVQLAVTKLFEHARFATQLVGRSIVDHDRRVWWRLYWETIEGYGGDREVELIVQTLQFDRYCHVLEALYQKRKAAPKKKASREGSRRDADRHEPPQVRAL